MTLEPKNQHDITDETYYTQAVGKQYLSVHALMSYLKNPALFYLKGNGYLKNTSSPSADAGRLFHAFMHDETDFLQEVRNLGKTPFSLGRKKYSDEEIVEMIYNDPEELKPKGDFEAVWQFIQNNWYKRHDIWNETDGVKELILTGTIGEAPFKGRLDKLTIEDDKAYIYDYKTLALKEFYGFWYEDDERFEKSFIHEYNYDLQMTAYAELVKQNFPQVKDVYITFGILVKKGKYDFTEYPSSYIETTTENIKDLYTHRFNGRSPLAVLMEESLGAYNLLNMDSDTFMKLYGKNSVYAELVLNTGTKLDFSDFRLK